MITQSSSLHLTPSLSLPKTVTRVSVFNKMTCQINCSDLDHFAGVGHKVVDAAGEVIRKYFRKTFDVVDKHDFSPVTIADKKAEESMVSIIEENFPSHAIFGEENGWKCKEESAEYVWVLDPIDGTKSFITGKPLFGTLVALLHHGKPILGIIDQPILRERWIGVVGRKTTLNGQEISTRNCAKLSQAYLYTTSPHLFSEDAEVAFTRVRNKVKVPLYGCDCYAYALLASGFVDLVIESGLKTYMRCQMKKKTFSLENQWCLQPVSVPSAGLDLSLHANSVQEAKTSLSHNTSQVELDSYPFCNKEGNDKLTCCDECTSKYEKEAAITLINKDLNKTKKPFWLQSHLTDMQKDDLTELRRKWNRLCHIQHPARPIQNNVNSPLFDNRNSSNDKSYTCPSNPSWLNKSSLLDSNSISFAHSNPNVIRTTSSCPRFRRQKSCHIELNYSKEIHKDQVLKANLNSLKNSEVEITLALGNSLNSNGGKLVEMKNEILQKLKENVPWQVANATSILEALVEESKSGKKENWLLIEGNDCVGKGRFAQGIAESLFGSVDYLLLMNMRVKENEKNLLCGTLENALRVHENLVVLVENVDFAGAQFLKLLSDQFIGERVGDGEDLNSLRKEGKSGQIIFILTKDDSMSRGDSKDLNDLGKKRKTEGNSLNKAKNPRVDEIPNAFNRENTSAEVYIKQSSSNNLDLNMKAEDDENENEGKLPETAKKILEMVTNRFVFDRDSRKCSI